MRGRRVGIQMWLIAIGWTLVLLVPLFSAQAKEANAIRTQGLINPGGNPKAGYLFINEMRVYYDKATLLLDQRETPIPITEFTAKKWVYMEVEKDSRGKIRARKMYLLPHYINPKERKKLSFMK